MWDPVACSAPSREVEGTLSLQSPELWRLAQEARLRGERREVTHTPSPQYYTCSCILAFVACSVFLRMSLELKVVLLTVALVAYLVLFNVSQWSCCGLGLDNLSKTNVTLRWGPSRSLQDPGPPPP